ncbi:MAG: DUF465 domain-containing protein [Burkholderiaceae bacterium]|nr:MAG: DUF465 domain-containing protein [Burkholderiaceae bacterium]
MNQTEGKVVLEQRLVTLQVEHRDLDQVINRLALEPVQDELQLRRLKKRKLQLKDNIILLQQQLTPDIPA